MCHDSLSFIRIELALFGDTEITGIYNINIEVIGEYCPYPTYKLW